MSRWKIEAAELTEAEKTYTASFTCTNVDADQFVRIQLTQQKGESAINLIGALRALAQLLVKAAGSDQDLPGTSIEKLN